MSRLAFLILFSILVSLDLYQVYYDGSMRYLTKPTIMISLIIYYLSHVKGLYQGRTRWLFLLALIGALGGDSFLLFEDYFVYGLLSFLVMQVIYSYCFHQQRSWSKQGLIFTCMLGIIVAIVMSQLWPELGSLKIPVLVYTSAIAAMSITAFNRSRDISGYWMVFIGTLLFIISDSVLAIHKFDVGLNLGKLTVMSTYAYAQYLIVQGYIDGALKKS